MTKRVAFFTAGDIPTAGEQTDIDELNDLLNPGYQILERNGASGVSPNYGHGKEEFDFVAGTPPAAYAASDTINPDATTGTFISGSTAKVQNSAVSASVNGGISFSGGNPIVTLPATEALVANAGSVTVKNSAGNVSKTGTATVALGVISGVALAATVALATHGDTVTASGSGTTATLTVSSGKIQSVALS